MTNNFVLAGIGTNAEPIGAIRMGNSSSHYRQDHVEW